MPAVPFNDYGPFDTGIGANRTEDWWREYAGLLLSDGVIDGAENELETFGDSSGLQVKVKSGRHWQRGHWAKLTAQQTLAIGANSSGSPRIDRVVARVDTVNNRVELDVIQGTPAGSPTAPVVATGPSLYEQSLAQVAVANGAATIAAANVTDERVFAGPGGSIRFGARARRNTDMSVATGADVDVVVSTEDWNDLPSGRLHETATNPERFYVPFGGRWSCVAQSEWDANATGYRTTKIVDSTGKEWAKVRAPATTDGLTQQAVAHEMRLAKGQWIKAQVRQTSGGSRALIGTVNGGETFVHVTYLGV